MYALTLRLTKYEILRMEIEPPISNVDTWTYFILYKTPII